MQRTLSLRLQAEDAPAIATARAAIRSRRCLTGRYNGGLVVIAPYLLYERHGVPHLAATTSVRDGRELRPDKLSVYRLSGVQDLALASAEFTPVVNLLSTHTHAVDRVLATVLEPAIAPRTSADKEAQQGAGASTRDD